MIYDWPNLGCNECRVMIGSEFYLNYFIGPLENNEFWLVDQLKPREVLAPLASQGFYKGLLCVLPDPKKMGAFGTVIGASCSCPFIILHKWLSISYNYLRSLNFWWMHELRWWIRMRIIRDVDIGHNLSVEGATYTIYQHLLSMISIWGWCLYVLFSTGVDL